MKKLIVNADDFGMAENVNEGIIRGHKEGIITSTSLLAGGIAAKHAAALAKETPSLGVGVHLCLTLERPVSEPGKIPNLAPGGMFPDSPFKLMFGLLSGRINKREIETELRAQVEKTLALGITPDHIDGHQHVHLMPGIFDIVLRLVKEYSIPAMRYPVGPSVTYAGIGRAMEKIILEGFAKRNGRAIAAAGLAKPDYFFGLAETGKLDAGKLIKIIEALPDGTSELMCHPGLPGASLAADNWGAGWGKELEAVLDNEIKKKIETERIELLNYKFKEKE